MPERPTPPTPNAPAVLSFRGDSLENSFLAHAVVVDADGTVLMGFGDMVRKTLARSAAKPAQALAMLESGAFGHFDFDEADLALMCASHSSEGRHIERTLSMLSKVGAHESDLRCGGHTPISEAVNRDWIKRDFVPTPVCSNCSGKHVGMLAGARALGQSMQDYHLPEHPVQQYVKKVLADALRLTPQEVDWGIDGCNLPTPAFALDRLAYLYASLAHASDAVELAGGASPAARTAALARIFHAMTRHPELVAGEGRFCTLLMQAFGGALVGKMGADACYGMGIRASEQTRRLGAKGAIGIGVKVEDGNVDVVYMLVSEILERLQIGTPEQRAALDAFHHPRMVNTRGVTVGHVEYPFALHRVAAAK
ncbi:MAG: asparaginase [Rhodoferax sp.]